MQSGKTNKRIHPSNFFFIELFTPLLHCFTIKKTYNLQLLISLFRTEVENNLFFLNKTLSFSLLLAFHQQAESCAQQTKKMKTPELSNCRFPEITLYTSQIEEQYFYYATTLKLPIINRDKTQFTINIGDSILRFKEIKDGSNPLYHYAINIPSNKLDKAKKWLSEKTPLLLNPESGEDVFHFESWDAHAIYFKDPSGNIGELIARHTLDNDREGEFDTDDLLCISEIGVPVEDPHKLAAALKGAYGLENYAGSAMFIGDENGLFVAPTIDRPWFPERTVKASVYPTDIYISDDGDEQFNFEKYPYQIKRKQ